MTKKQLEDKIKKLIETLKVFIRNDGGDIEFVSLEKGILTIKIFGACVNCPHADMTFDNGIKVVIMQEIPEIKDVLFVNNEITI